MGSNEGVMVMMRERGGEWIEEERKEGCEEEERERQK